MFDIWFDIGFKLVGSTGLISNWIQSGRFDTKPGTGLG
jgi:hypothetical protein